MNKNKKQIFIVAFIFSIIIPSVFPRPEYIKKPITGPLDYGLTNYKENKFKIDNFSKKYDLNINSSELADGKEWDFFKNKLSRRINFGFPFTNITLQDYPYDYEYLYIIIISKNNFFIRFFLNMALYIVVFISIYFLHKKTTN